MRDALRRASNRHKRRWREVTARIHVAESKTDLPVVCGGGLALVRETLADRLRARGFRRCSTLADPAVVSEIQHRAEDEKAQEAES